MQFCAIPLWKQPLFFAVDLPGTLPSNTSFSLHAFLVDHFLKGGWYPSGGASEIAFHTIPIIKRAGGAVLTKAMVQNILLDSEGKAYGEQDWVRVESTCTGCLQGLGQGNKKDQRFLSWSQ